MPYLLWGVNARKDGLHKVQNPLLFTHCKIMDKRIKNLFLDHFFSIFLSAQNWVERTFLPFLTLITWPHLNLSHSGATRSITAAVSSIAAIVRSIVTAKRSIVATASLITAAVHCLACCREVLWGDCEVARAKSTANSPEPARFPFCFSFSSSFPSFPFLFPGEFFHLGFLSFFNSHLRANRA